MMTAPFTRNRMEKLRPEIQRFTDELIDTMLAGPKPVDPVEALALPLPSLMICALLGVPYEDHEFFQEHASLATRSDKTAEQDRAAKAGTVGMACSAKLAGEPHNIKVNLIAPAAMTRMGGGPEEEPAETAEGMPYMASAAVAPMVAYLAHENCPVSGEIYTAGAGRFARVFLASTEGYAHAGGAASVEDIARNWDAINDEKGYYVPADLMAWSGSFLRHQFGQDGLREAGSVDPGGGRR
nr:hypothetical protein OG999_09740 [Streptomyces sp. NBC_00886]